MEWGGGTGTQCVELPKWYAESITGKANKANGLGHGNTLAQGIANHHGWQLITDKNNIMVGDIISFNGLSGVNTWDRTYGHVVVVYEVSGSTFRYVEQWQASGTVRNGSAMVGRSDIAYIT